MARPFFATILGVILPVGTALGQGAGATWEPFALVSRTSSYVAYGARRILLEVRYTRGWVPVVGTARQRVLSAGVGVTFPRQR